MQVVLLKTIPALGKAGETREVKKGYALNYLLPQKLVALPGQVVLPPAREPKNLKVASQRLTETVAKLEKTFLQFEQEGNEKGTLYAAVNKTTVRAALARAGFKVSLQAMEPAQIKTAGEHSVKIILAAGVEAQLKLKIKVK